MNILKAIAVAALLLNALHATGADAEKLDVKLGLWEMTSVMRFSGMPPLPKSLLERMTPEQQASMREELKAAAEQEPEPEVSSECVRQGDLDRPFKPAASEHCTQTLVRSTRNIQEMRLECTGAIKGSGLLRIAAPTPETMTGEFDLKAGEGPDAFSLKGTIKGRWLGPDCGAEEDDEDETAGP